MSTRARYVMLIAIGVLAATPIAIAWRHSQPISTPLRIGIAPDEVRRAFTSDAAGSYSFYGDENWCTRGIFHVGDLFSYHTWIGYTFDAHSKLVSAHGYHAVTIELPFIGFHDHEFPMRDIELPRDSMKQP